MTRIWKPSAPGKLFTSASEWALELDGESIRLGVRSQMVVRALSNDGCRLVAEVQSVRVLDPLSELGAEFCEMRFPRTYDESEGSPNLGDGLARRAS